MSEEHKYDLMIIGAGSAGLIAAVSAGALGARTALVEKEKIGGECSWTGCVPSKSLIEYAAKLKAFDNGLKGSRERRSEYIAGVFRHIKDIRKKASESSKVKKLLKKYDVDIIYGDPSFIDRRHIEIDGRKYIARKYIISTGSSPLIPEFEGLKPYYITNRDIWDLPGLPGSMIIIGAGPIGIEFAQSLQRLGVRIDIIDIEDRILKNDDLELSRTLMKILEDEGVTFHLGSSVKRIDIGKQRCLVELEKGIIESEKLLIAAGRKANTEGLGLKEAGVRFDQKGIIVGRDLKTTAPGIWAAGDCNGMYQFSHIAEIEAKNAVRNALFPFNSKIDYQGVPWTTFTDPESAHLGMTEEQCKEKNIRYRVYRQYFSGDDRAIIEGHTSGLVKIISGFSGKLLGVHILGPRAGERINEFVLARRKSLGIYDIGMTSHVYPSLGLAVQRATDQWFAELSEKKMIRKFINLFRI